MSFATFPQTTYRQNFVPGQKGQLYRPGHNTHEKFALSAVAACQPGDLLERLLDATSGSYAVRPAQSANGALYDLAGVAIYKSMRMPYEPPYSGTLATGYQIGDMVEHVRKGKVYAKWSSKDGTTAQLSYTVPNYSHSTTTYGSDTAGVNYVAQGGFTDHATSATAGSEVDACPAWGVKLCEDQTGLIDFYTCLVDLNLT